MAERHGRAVERLEIILDQIDLIQAQLAGKTFRDFAADRDVSDLVAYRIHNIGENCHRLDDEVKSRHRGLPWEDIYGMRNIISHDYGRINPARVWSVAVEHLAAIKAMASGELARALASSSDGTGLTP